MQLIQWHSILDKKSYHIFKNHFFSSYIISLHYHNGHVRKVQLAPFSDEEAQTLGEVQILFCGNKSSTARHLSAAPLQTKGDISEKSHNRKLTLHALTSCHVLLTWFHQCTQIQALWLHIPNSS